MNLTLKFVFIGDAGAGKTAINHKFITGEFNESLNKSTVGVVFSCRQFQFKKYKYPIKVHFWDTAGQERFRSIVPMYYRGSSVILLIYDINNRQSFQNIMDYWIGQIKDENCFKIYLIGNKRDLNRQVSEGEAKLLAKKHGFEYKEISAKEDNLEPLLNEIILTTKKRIEASQISSDKLKFYGVNIENTSTIDNYFPRCC